LPGVALPPHPAATIIAIAIASFIDFIRRLSHAARWVSNHP